MKHKVVKYLDKKGMNNNFVKNSLRFILFCMVGGASFLIDWSFFNIFYGLVGLGFAYSITFSVGISMIFNFSVNRNVTFSARGHQVGKQISKWLVVYLIAFLFRLGSGKIILSMLGENLVYANFAFLIGLGLSIPISFFGSLLWAFKKKN